MVADFRSLLPAALVTMFGIGAELGALGVLAFSLSDRTAAFRYSALAVIIVMAATILAYAIATTLALADPKPGSAMTADSATSATL
jgi:NhaP-type Na+/H+ and K+/H+ antiporter